MLTATDATMSLQSVRQDVEDVLQRFFEVSLVSATQMDTSYAALVQVMFDLSMSGGKRVRPYTTMLGYRAYGGTEYKAMLPIAAAEELLHQSMLIHDDIIDRDFVRYGRDNVQGSYSKKYRQKVSDDTDRLHYAGSVAILAGDLALSGAYQLILQSGLPAEKLIQAQKILGTAIFAVIGGELIDTESSFTPLDEVDTVKAALLKTASYSFVSPLIMGATMADAAPAEIEKLRKFGEALGIAYQLNDDILGVFGDPAVTGKSNSGDLREGKKTYLVQQAVDDASTDSKSLLRLLAKRDNSDVEIARMRQMILDSGARSSTETLRDKYLDTASVILDSLAISGADRAAFASLMTTVSTRVK